MRAKKFLGQNFLINKSKINKIVEALDLKKGDAVIEIGPGHGELTEELGIRNKELGIKIIAIEKDRELAKFLREKFEGNKNIEIIEGDALKALLAITKRLKNPKAYKIVGNIPYYITGYLFRILGDLKKKPSLVVFTIQKEVAERICAKPPYMNLLAASVQIWVEPEIIDIVARGNFRPIPKVDSAIVALRLRIGAEKYKAGKTGRKDRIDSEKYYRFIKILFKQPRKTILNNIESGIRNKAMLSGSQKSRGSKGEIIEKLEKLGINPSERPGNLDLEQIAVLTKNF